MCFELTRQFKQRWKIVSSHPAIFFFSFQNRQHSLTQLLPTTSLVTRHIKITWQVFWKYRFPSSVFGLPLWLSGKESTCNAGDAVDKGLIPESGRSPGEGNGNPATHSSSLPENLMDRGAQQAPAQRVTRSWVSLKCLSPHSSSICRHSDSLGLG